uniref:arylamine N-acetyltransferase n=2 Tax=Cyprinus carpio TaxID=7962 RepID=A0A9R1SMQ0_CYPCA
MYKRNSKECFTVDLWCCTQLYLACIGCVGPCPLTFEILRHIYLNHLMTVPFENLTIHIRERDSALRIMGFSHGFDVTILCAHVRNRFTGAYGPLFNHFIMMVKLDGHRWLCDVGFVSGFQLPLSLETDSPQEQSALPQISGKHFMEMKSETQVSGVGEECWTELYKFTLEPRERDDFRAMFSLFTGRIIIMGCRLIISLSSVDGRQATKTTRVFFTFFELLREKFGIVLHSPLTPKDVEIVPPPVTY